MLTAKPCLTACRARRLFILQSYVFLGAKPNYQAIFALNVRPAAMLSLRHRDTSDTAEKAFHRSISIIFHNCLIFNALQKAIF